MIQEGFRGTRSPLLAKLNVRRGTLNVLACLNGKTLFFPEWPSWFYHILLIKLLSPYCARPAVILSFSFGILKSNAFF